jgi:hypothetical protein
VAARPLLEEVLRDPLGRSALLIRNSCPQSGATELLQAASEMCSFEGGTFEMRLGQIGAFEKRRSEVSSFEEYRGR